MIPQPDESMGVLSGAELQAQNIHPLRCVYLGKHADHKAAAAKGMKWRGNRDTIISRNIRVACDRRQTRRWRLSEQEIALLQAGEVLRLRDGLGRFSVAYSQFRPAKP